MFDVIVLLNQRSDIAGCARRGNIFERLRRLRIEAHARHILRKHGNKRKAKALIKIGYKLIARHFCERAIIAKALLERQMPVHVVRIPPGVLQALPEKPSLANPPNLMTPRDHTFFAILAHQLAQRMHQLRLNILKPLIVRPIPDVSIRRRNRTRRSGPSLSCGIQVHSSSPLPCRQNLMRSHAPHWPRATPEFGATSVYVTAATPAASLAGDTPPTGILPYQAADSSARDSLRATAPLRPQAALRTALAAIVEENLSCRFVPLSGAAAAALAETACALRIRVPANEWRATLDRSH